MRSQLPTDPRRRRDPSRVSTTKEQLRYWCGRFMCTEDELKKAVAAVGVSVLKVEHYLESHRREAAARHNRPRALKALAERGAFEHPLSAPKSG